MEELVTLVMAIQLHAGHCSLKTSSEPYDLGGCREKTHPTGQGVYNYAVDVV